MARLTRKEKQAQTRECLMRSAARVFADRGLQHASIEEVADDAGFTKGAFYANFKSKEELFLAMLDEKFAHKVEEVERVLAGEGTESEKAMRAGDDFTKMMSADPEWQRLFFEFSAYAMRNDEFRQELVTRYRWLRDRMAAVLEAHDKEIGVECPLPYQQIALMTHVIANGVALEKLLDDEAVPDHLFGQMLIILFAGLNAVQEQANAISVQSS